MARGFWWLTVIASFLFFIWFLTLNQLDVKGLLPQQVMTTGFFGTWSQPINFAISAMLFVSSVVYFGILRNRQSKDRRTGFLVGIVFGVAVALAYFMISQLNWSTILPSSIVTAFIFLALGALVMVIKALDENVFNLYKLRAADIPIAMYGWEGATRLDLLLGVAGIFIPLFASLLLAQAVIIPPSILVAGAVSPLFAAVFGAAVVRFENSIFIGFIQKTIASWAVYFAKLGRLNKPTPQDIQDSRVIRWVAGLISLIPIFYITLIFHSGLYAGLGVTLLSTSMAFVIWGTITAWRGNTVAADIGHIGYNVIVGLLATGTAGAIALI